MSAIAILLLAASVTDEVIQAQNRPDLRFDQVPYAMSTNSVTAIAEDSLGFIWVGTTSGLNRFDGTQFTTYYSDKNENSLSDNVVGSIYVDRNEDIWVSGRSTVSRYRGETDDFVRYELRDPTGSGVFRRVRTITEDSRGIIWAAGGRHSLYFLDRENDTFRPYKPLLSHDITSIFICNDDIIWATTENSGLQRIDVQSGEITSYLHDPQDSTSISTNGTTAVVQDGRGDIWVGSLYNGVNRVVQSDVEITFVRYENRPGEPKVLENNHIYTMYTDNQGKLWLGNDNGGLHLYDPEVDKFHHYSSDPDDPYSLSHDSISKIYQDTNGRLWVGTALAGLNVSDRYASKFRHHHTRSRFGNRLSSNIIRGFEEDSDGTIWIATDGGGLNYLDRETGYFHAFRHDPDNHSSISSDAVISIGKDLDGRIWTGTYNGSLQLLVDKENGVFRSLEENYRIPTRVASNPFDFHFDSIEPYLWVAELRQGVFRIHTGTGEVKQFYQANGDTTSISSSFVLHIFEDSRKNLWFASLTGLSKLTPENKSSGIFRRYSTNDTDPSSIPGSTIRQITEDDLGRLWVTTDMGLAMYQPETDDFFVFKESDGLPHNDLRSITVDKNDNLWIGSVQGLTLFQPEIAQFHNYREQDGLQGYEFTPYAGHRLSTGELLFGGMNGFNIFYPDSIRTNPHVPPVYITDLKLFNESITVEQPYSPLDRHIMMTDEIALAHRQNVITIDFIALNFTNAKQNRYTYMMEGFDSDWIQAGTQRSATYTNLNPGTYQFRVKASNNDGVWNEEGTTLTIVIVPPFWQTSWFYAIVLLIVLLMLYAGFQYRVQGIRKRNLQLEKMVSQRTGELEERNRQLKQEIDEKQRIYSVLAHDLRGQFMTILGFSEYLSEKLSDSKDQENREISRMVLESSKNLFQLLENLLEWASAKRRHLKAPKERLDLHKLVSKAILTNEITAESKAVRLQNNCPVDAFAFGDKNMIQTVLRNLISNAIKFSGEDSEVTVTVHEEHGGYVISVNDTGIGMTEEEQEKALSAMGGYRKTGTKGEKGIGFGLMLSQDFIRENGGQFWVQSEKDKGSTFSFTLKRAS